MKDEVAIDISSSSSSSSLSDPSAVKTITVHPPPPSHTTIAPMVATLGRLRLSGPQRVNNKDDDEGAYRPCRIRDKKEGGLA
jgi:hypothetical protein